MGMMTELGVSCGSIDLIKQGHIGNDNVYGYVRKDGSIRHDENDCIVCRGGLMTWIYDYGKM